MRKRPEQPNLIAIEQPIGNLIFNNLIFQQIYQSPLNGCICLESATLYNVKETDMSLIAQLGHGSNGSVTKQLILNYYVMAVKELKLFDPNEMKNALMELNVLRSSSICPYIIKYYGYIATMDTLYVCMEEMATCLDTLQKHIPNHKFPEQALGYIASSVLQALDYLKTKNIIHRDVKPSNMLVNKNGKIKMCDFAISGVLIDSIARSTDTLGCLMYLAPERLESIRTPYDVRSDVWSFGISLYKLATGQIPYKHPNEGQINEFVYMERIHDWPSPQLLSKEMELSDNCCLFVNDCLSKNRVQRPKYRALMEYQFFIDGLHDERNAANFLSKLI